MFSSCFSLEVLNHQVRLTCRVNGRPAPEIIWYKGGRQVGQDERHKVIVNEQGCHALLITSALLTDQGEIGCIARNRSGEAGFTVASLLLSNGKCFRVDYF